MKISHYLGIAMVLLAMNTAMANNQVTISAFVDCPLPNTLDFADQTITPTLNIPQTWDGVYTGLIKAGGCGPWSVSVKSDKDDGRMTTSSGSHQLGAQLNALVVPQSAGTSDGWIVPTTTPQELVHSDGNDLAWFDGYLKQPTAYTDVEGTYGMVLTFTYAGTV